MSNEAILDIEEAIFDVPKSATLNKLNPNAKILKVHGSNLLLESPVNLHTLAKVDLNKFVPKELNQRNVDGVKKFFNSAADTVILLFDTFKDGYQFSDTFKIPTIISSVNKTRDYFKEAKKDIEDELTGDEVAQVTEVFLSRLLSFFKNLPQEGEGAFGVNAIRDVYNHIENAVTITAEALEDGFQLEDLRELPSIGSSVISAGFRIPKVYLEIKDLTKDEILVITSELAGRLWDKLGR